MYSFLRGEMIRTGYPIVKLAQTIGISEKSMRNKLKGETGFTWEEAKAIHKIINPSLSMEELFKKDEEVNV